MSAWRSLVILHRVLQRTVAVAVVPEKWNKRRKQDERQKAMNAFSEAFGIDGMEPGDPARAISRGGVVILVYRSEEKMTITKQRVEKSYIAMKWD